DLPLPLVRIGMGEVRRETQHRRNLPRLPHHVHDWVDVLRRQAPKELVVVLDTLAAERGRISNPAFVRHPAFDERVEVTLRKDTNPWWHDAYQFGGAPTGYCSRSSTAPVTRALASDAKYSAAAATSSGVSRRPNGRVAIALGSQSGSCS